LKLIHQVHSSLAGFFNQIFLLNHFQYGQCCCAGQLITTKGSSQHAMFGLYRRCNQNPSYWEAVPHSLCHRIDVCINACIIVREKFTTSSVATLNTIGNKHSLVLIAETSYKLQKRFVCNPNTTNSLYS